jgi:putative peptidoglycan lipid II flippase
MALQTATLPSLSRLVARGDRREVEETFSYALRLTLFVGIAASAAAVFLAEPLTVLIFQRGKFDAVSSHETAKALAAQGLGIWMVASVRQLVALYYAYGDTKSPVRVAALDLCVFIGLALVLRRPLGHLGVSIAVTGASFVQMILLAFGLKGRLTTLKLSPIAKSTGKTLVSALIAALLANLLSKVSSFPSSHGAVALAVPGVVAISTYTLVFFVVAKAVGSEELSTLTQAFRRRRQRA